MTAREMRGEADYIVFTEFPHDLVQEKIEACRSAMQSVRVLFCDDPEAD